MDLHISNFIDYCINLFPQIFNGIILNNTNLTKAYFKSNKVITDYNNIGSYDIVICESGKTLSEIIYKLTGLLIFISKIENFDNDHKKILSLNEFKKCFGYYKFYYCAEGKYLFGLAIKDFSIERYIPDYKADYKISQKNNRKTVVVYTFHEITENVKFFVRHGIFKSFLIDFIIVCNGPHKIDVPEYVTYINRENIGHDFGGWSHAIHSLDLEDKYQYFVLINSSVRGPFIPAWSPMKNWVDIFTRLIDYQTKLVGTSIGIYNYMAHIQSMVLVFDKIGLEIGIKEEIFEKNPIQRPRWDIITNKEVGFSQAILKKGYKIRPILDAYYNSYIGIRPLVKDLDHLLGNRYFGTYLHPYDVIFIKDKYYINDNRDINNLTDIHDNNFDKLPKIPPDFDWIKYLHLNPEVAKYNNSENASKEHWIICGSKQGLKYK